MAETKPEVGDNSNSIEDILDRYLPPTPKIKVKREPLSWSLIKNNRRRDDLNKAVRLATAIGALGGVAGGVTGCGTAPTTGEETVTVAKASTDSPMAQATASGIPTEAYGFTLTPTKEVMVIGGEFPAEVLNSPVFQDRFNEANKLAQALVSGGITGKLFVPDMYAAQVDGVAGGVIASYLLISDQGELIQGTTPREAYFLSGSGEDQKLLKLVIPESREAGALLTDENARNFYTSFDPKNMEAKMVLVLGEGDKPAELRVMIFEYQTDQTIVLGYFDTEGVFQRVDSFVYQPPEGYSGANMDGIMTVTGGQLYGREVLYGAQLATEVELPGLPPSAIGTLEPEVAGMPTTVTETPVGVQPIGTTGPTPPPDATPLPSATEIISVPTVAVEPTGASVPEATQAPPTGVPEATGEPVKETTEVVSEERVSIISKDPRIAVEVIDKERMEQEVQTYLRRGIEEIYSGTPESIRIIQWSADAAGQYNLHNFEVPYSKNTYFQIEFDSSFEKGAGAVAWWRYSMRVEGDKIIISVKVNNLDGLFTFNAYGIMVEMVGVFKGAGDGDCLVTSEDDHWAVNDFIAKMKEEGVIMSTKNPSFGFSPP